jgi:hypothetical protein
MLTISYGNTAETRQQLITELQTRRTENPQYRVIDVGGAINGWSRPVATMIVDVNAADSSNSMKLDICRTDSWDKLLAHVQFEGKYDYAICTHTLEDIYNPITALELLPKIANAGVITMPSIRAELSRAESQFWLGYIHHRWIFDQQDEQMLVIPKLEVLDALVADSIKYQADTEEVIFQWQDRIPYTMFMNNYLGPNADAVINSYNELIRNIRC